MSGTPIETVYVEHAKVLARKDARKDVLKLFDMFEEDELDEPEQVIGGDN